MPKALLLFLISLLDTSFQTASRILSKVTLFFVDVSFQYLDFVLVAVFDSRKLCFLKCILGYRRFES